MTTDVRLKLPPWPGSDAEVVVEGVDLTKHVSEIRLDAGVGRVTELVLTFPIVIAAAEGSWRVVVDGATHDALVRLGWTPPGGES